MARIEFQERGEDPSSYLAQPQLTREFAFRKEAVPPGHPRWSVRAATAPRRPRSAQGAVARAGTPVGSAHVEQDGGERSEFAVVDVGAGGRGRCPGRRCRSSRRWTITSMKEPERRIDMQAEFLDLSAINTGRYKGMVIQDPTDKHQRHRLRLPGAAPGGAILEPSRPRALQPARARCDQQLDTRIEAQEWTSRCTSTPRPSSRRPSCTSRRTGSAFELTKHEAKPTSGSYLRNGGFVAGGQRPLRDHGVRARPRPAMQGRCSSEALGRDARFVPLRDDNPIYHVFFDFDGGPPPGRGGPRTGLQPVRGHPTAFLLAGGDLSPATGWWPSTRTRATAALWERETENEPQLKLGVNHGGLRPHPEGRHRPAADRLLQPAQPMRPGQ